MQSRLGGGPGKVGSLVLGTWWEVLAPVAVAWAISIGKQRPPVTLASSLPIVLQELSDLDIAASVEHGLFTTGYVITVAVDLAPYKDEAAAKAGKGCANRDTDCRGCCKRRRCWQVGGVRTLPGS